MTAVGRRPTVLVAVVAVVVAASAAVAGCSSDDAGSGPTSSTTTAADDASEDGASEDLADPCALLLNTDVEAAVDAPVVGSSPAAGVDRGCNWGFGDTTNVATPDGPYVQVSVVDPPLPEDGVEVDELRTPAVWDDDEQRLSFEAGDAVVAIVVAGEGPADAQAAAVALAAIVEDQLSS